jgi:hypothetical protein
MATFIDIGWLELLILGVVLPGVVGLVVVLASRGGRRREGD